MKLILASLAFLTTTSTAGTPPTGSPKVCKKEGSPLISLHHLGDPAQLPPSKDSQPAPLTGAFVIWPSGGYTSFDQDLKTGKVSNERNQCLDDADFTAVKDALAKATWKFTQAKIRCMAISFDHTEWTAKDKIVWDDRMCSGDIPDATTKKAIEFVQGLETKLTAKTKK